MIRILDINKKTQAMIKDYDSPWIYEEINGEYTLSFNCVASPKNVQYINENYIVSVNGDWFNMVYYKADDIKQVIEAECEHFSYLLNDEIYDLNTFVSAGTVTEILQDILNGTPLITDTVELADTIAFSTIDKMSRRGILITFANEIGAELYFYQDKVSLLQRRGSRELKTLQRGKNVNISTKIYSERELILGNPLVSYTCQPIEIKGLSLGDDVYLIQTTVGTKETLRIVTYGYNPVDRRNSEIEISNKIATLEDSFHKIDEKIANSNTRITVNAKGIALNVADTEGNSSLITQNADNIELKVSALDYTGDNIVSKINLSSTTIEIAASKINLVGYVTILGLTDGITTISGDNIKTGTINANRISTSISQVNKLLYLGDEGSIETKEIRFASGTRITGGSDGIGPWLRISSSGLNLKDPMSIHIGNALSTVICEGGWDFSGANITGFNVTAVFG